MAVDNDVKKVVSYQLKIESTYDFAHNGGQKMGKPEVC
jgi:hypothetical protein